VRQWRREDPAELPSGNGEEWRNKEGRRAGRSGRRGAKAGTRRECPEKGRDRRIRPITRHRAEICGTSLEEGNAAAQKVQGESAPKKT